MNDEHDLLAARISGWLSGALDPLSTQAVGRLVDRDAEARRLAGGYHRVDTIVRDWYESLSTEPVKPVAVPRRAGARARHRQLAVAAALLVLVVPASRIDTARAMERLFDAVAERIGGDGDRQLDLAPTACWRLRSAELGKLPNAGSAASRAVTVPSAG